MRRILFQHGLFKFSVVFIALCFACSAQAADRFFAVSAVVEKLSRQMINLRTCGLDYQKDDAAVVKFWNKQVATANALIIKAGFTPVQVKQLVERMNNINPAFDDQAKASDLMTYCAAQPNWRRELVLMEFTKLAISVEKALAGPPPEKDDAAVLAAIETAMSKWRLSFSCEPTDVENAGKDVIFWKNATEKAVEELKRFAISQEVHDQVMKLLADRFEPQATIGTVADLKRYCFVEHTGWRNAYEKAPWQYLKDLQPAP
jgi:hypothetical protein